MPFRPSRAASFFALTWAGLVAAFVIPGQPLTTLLASAFLTRSATADTVAATPVPLQPLAPEAMPLVDAADVDAETLWLARCIFSETKEPVEQELVAWVLRNRVETEYRGAMTYEEAVLDPYQFSAFNPESGHRAFYSGLTPADATPGWRRALAIARYVKASPVSFRPFEGTTRHFYSEQSMVGRSHPDWAEGQEPVAVARPVEIDAERFRFYADVR